jgi:hypothetical protein
MGLRFNWAVEPLHVRLFILYLFVAVIVTIVRSLKLTRRIYTLQKRNGVSLRDISHGGISANELAQFALTNRLLVEPSPFVGDYGSGDAETSGEKPTLRTLQIADTKFRYLWQLGSVDVAFMKKLVRLTLLLSLLLVVYGAFPTWSEEFNDHNVTGTVALHRAAGDLLARVTIGVTVSVLIYMVSILFDGSLRRRKTRWRYFYESSRNALSSERSLL